MLQRIKCLFGKHRLAIALTDPDGEFEIEDKTYPGEINLQVCVECKKVIGQIKWESKIAFEDRKETDT